MQMIRYEAARQAIAEYKTVDEVKDFRDKALAIEAYAKQANDYELERDAAIARVRAERRCGELLADMNKAPGARGNPGGQGAAIVRSHDTTAQTRTLSDLGITKDQSSKWQRLAAVPEAEFEAAISQPGSKPSTTHIISPKQEQPKRMDSLALWFWGRLIDMERNQLFERSVDSLMGEMTDAMRQDAERLFPKLKRWLQ
jgi:hypothetical protein